MHTDFLATHGSFVSRANPIITLAIMILLRKSYHFLAKKTMRFVKTIRFGKKTMRLRYLVKEL